ncbi:MULTISPECIES: nucleotide disphospho-sugar-binding domain-containing protein [Actinomadura]|uniref:Nucleotide disphospho-sugar-binding domain-containing protein n=1 Tax=Actinomadura yumaensis TaxID=111807 RepID=A0ABW2CNI7_9ACTN|nr:nucleotide disphospho-sugar-binding domain-containing protein [Actinomadura sp. J1-007]MWK36727.1 DUF1205 domain-containing protein [Actinomadura sp. J1-007]
MRILFTTWAWPSHLYAMVPLAWACRSAGHEVLVASQPELTGAIQATGLTAAPVGHHVDAVGVFRDIVRPPDGGGRGGGGPRVLGLLTALADSMTDDLARLAKGWRADAVVFEPTCFAGPLAAAVAGVPAIRHLYGTDLLGAAGRFLPDALAPLCERLGLDGVDPFGIATVDPCPAGLQLPTGSPRLPMRYVPYNGPGRHPRPLPPAASPGRPRVCVTWGTTMSRLDPELFLAGDAVRAVADLDVDVVAAVTPGQRATLGAVPSGVHIAQSAPLHLLLPRCDAVVAHGGAGSLLTALAAGLPQVLVPRLPDHVRHAARIAETGAGAVLPAPVEDPAAIRDRLAEVLAEPAYRDAAGRLRGEMLAQPSPAAVVPEIERVVARSASGPVQPVSIRR